METHALAGIRAPGGGGRGPAILIQARHEFDRGKVPPVLARISCKDGPAFDRGMRADEEVGQHLPAGRRFRR